MKISILVTLIITIAVFSFVSGYSISVHNKMDPGYGMAGQADNINNGTATAAEYTSAASGGYGSPDSEKGASSPGYGQ
jgi:Na+(H+)/acetate symporter ActP